MEAIALIAVVISFGLAVLVLSVMRRATGLEQRLRHAHVKLEELERTFQRFAPPEVVENIAEDEFAHQPEQREVAVLFADLRGFTAMSEKLEPTVIVDILNGYFCAMDSAITSHHGRVSKFMGDGLIALFGATAGNPWKARDSVQSALSMRGALVDYNLVLAEHGHPTLAIGIGIHVGEVVAGVMGSQRLKEFTVIGDVVNTASRIEQLTRRFDVDILITDSVKAGLDERFELRPMAPSQVKGKGEPVQTHAVVSFRG